MSHINACWQLPNGITDKTNVAARIIFELNPDGTLKGDPMLVQLTIHPQGAAYGKSAIDAIKRCAPYTFLPTEEYKGGWERLDMTFSGDPAATAALKSGPQIDTDEIVKKLHQIRRERNDKIDTH